MKLLARVPLMAAALLAMLATAQPAAAGESDKPTTPKTRRVLYNLDGDSCMWTKKGGKTPVVVSKDLVASQKLQVHKILFLGNSITCCPPKYWGLAASTAEKDYAHLLAGAINANTGGSLTMIRSTAPVTHADGSVDVGESNVVNIADVFERAYASYNAAKLRKQIAWKADLVVLQFGENIPPATFQAEVFKDGLKKLVADLKQSSNPHIFMPSYILGSNATVDEIKRNVCAEDPSHRVFVDMSRVGQDASNMGDYGHPNDKGMALIAETLFRAVLAHFATVSASTAQTGFYDVPVYSVALTGE
jgi:lysophospholipase L1-like esterase